MRLGEYTPQNEENGRCGKLPLLNEMRRVCESV